MKIVVVASQNPVKIEAVRKAFVSLFADEQFEFMAVTTPSGVSDQPMSNSETLHGAINRASSARAQFLHADYWVGIEGGVVEEEGGMTSASWVVVLSQSRMGKARTGTFFLPPAVADLFRDGKEMGEADDIVFGRTNSKQQNGAIGLLTGDVVNRTSFYEQAVILALLPFKNPNLYP
jgi:inosine/xanthosine triphosphatase